MSTLRDLLVCSEYVGGILDAQPRHLQDEDVVLLRLIPGQQRGKLRFLLIIYNSNIINPCLVKVIFKAC